MFKIGTKGLEESQQFNGKKETFNNFAKLIGHKMKEIQVLEALGVAFEWDDPASSNTTKEGGKKVKTHVKMVWAETPHGIAADETPKYFGDFGGAKPADQTELTAAKN
eukprot:4683214-Ditylum_brightwellii.AAC.1